MDKQMLLSIIVPVYNAEKYVGQCINSLINQDIDKDEYEIICINDGSKDNSLAILREYEKINDNIVVVDKENGGVSKARNLGLDMAKGEYVWFVDADDWIARNCLGLIKEAVSLHNPSVLQLHFDYIKAEWRVREKKEICLLKEEVMTTVVNGEAMRYDGAWSSIVRRDFLSKIGHKFREELAYGEDILFVRELFDYLKLSQGKEISNCVVHLQGDIFYYYRMNDDSAMRSAWKNHRKKYAGAMLQLARIDKAKASDEDKPDWYKQEYRELFYRRIYNYMMSWLPGLQVDIKSELKVMRDEGLYPCAKMPKSIKNKIYVPKNIKEKLVGFCRYKAFCWPWLYCIYFKIMNKKWRK